MSMGHTYKFFGFYISHTILTLPIYFPPIIFATYSLYLFSLSPSFPHYSSCPWVILISSLASTFPILFLPSPCLSSTYHLCYLFSVPFLPLSPSHSPADNPPCDLHFCGSVSVLIVCLVFFCFGLCWGRWADAAERCSGGLTVLPAGCRLPAEHQVARACHHLFSV